MSTLIQIKRFIVFILVAATVSFMVGCKKPPADEVVIREIIDEAAVAAEEKDVKNFIRHVSEDYADDYGNDRDGIKRFVLYELLRRGVISVFVRGVDIEVKDARAFADVKAVMVRGERVKSIKDILPENAAGYRFNIVFEKEDDGEWRAVTAEWQNVGLAAII